jgi:hypothetical protein
MRAVWITLKKRIVNDSELFDYFNACERGIACWRGDQKLTISQRRVFYTDISKTALKLLLLMRDASEFDGYDVPQLVPKNHIQSLLEELESPYKDHSFAFLSVSGCIPSIIEILIDISTKARKHADEESSIKRPTARNAELNHFIRYISNYFQGSFHQPLHQAVAITTSVIFDDADIDSDHVRQIVKPKP